MDRIAASGIWVQARGIPILRTCSPGWLRAPAPFILLHQRCNTGARTDPLAISFPNCLAIFLKWPSFPRGETFLGRLSPPPCSSMGCVYLDKCKTRGETERVFFPPGQSVWTFLGSTESTDIRSRMGRTRNPGGVARWRGVESGSRCLYGGGWEGKWMRIP